MARFVPNSVVLGTKIDLCPMLKMAELRPRPAPEAGSTVFLSLVGTLWPVGSFVPICAQWRPARHKLTVTILSIFVVGWRDAEACRSSPLSPGQEGSLTQAVARDCAGFLG